MALPRAFECEPARHVPARLRLELEVLRVRRGRVRATFPRAGEACG
jgi:hypothetical protein